MTLMFFREREVRRGVTREPRPLVYDAKQDQAVAIEPELARLVGPKSGPPALRR